MTKASQVLSLEKALAIPGWMSLSELTWLASRASECSKIVEFGCFHGRSTRAMADNTSGTIWAVDPWSGDYPTESGEILKQVNTFVMPEFLDNLKEHVESKRVLPIRQYSTTFNLPFQVDMVFLDGDHRYATVVKDIEKSVSLVKEGGIISGHDYGHPLWTGVKKAVDELLGPVKVVDTIWWMRKF